MEPDGTIRHRTRPPAWLKQLGNSASGVFAVDSCQRILTWNLAAERLLGHSAARAVGRSCHEVIDGRLRSGQHFCCADCKVEQCVRRGAILHTFELLTRTAAGDHIWLSVSITGLQARDGPIALHTVSRVEHRHRSEDALNEILATLKTYGLAKREGRADHDIQICCEPAEACSNPLSALTRRELDVLGLLTRGYATEDISRELSISVLTTRCHIQNMLKKTKLHSRTALVSVALRNGRARG
jgi:PAS domain S-box-containing protein